MDCPGHQAGGERPSRRELALWFNGVRYEQPQENAAIYAEYLNGMTKFYRGGHQGCWLY